MRRPYRNQGREHIFQEKKLDQAKSLRRKLAEDVVKVSIEISSELREILSQKNSQIPKAEIASIAASITKQKLDDIREEIENQIVLETEKGPLLRQSAMSKQKLRARARVLCLAEPITGRKHPCNISAKTVLPCFPLRSAVTPQIRLR